MRRGLNACQRLSSVNDGAPWIDRITSANFLQAVQIIDWSHAKERLWKVSKAVYGEQTPTTKQWAEKQVEELWCRQVADVICSLQNLSLNQSSYPDDVCQAPGYFETRTQKMVYDRFRAEGRPIGSGTVESGINSVIHHRLNRPGRGWKRNNGQAMSAALSELHSGRFDDAWISSSSVPV